MPEGNFHTGHLFLTAISSTQILASWDNGQPYIMQKCYSKENSAKLLCAAVWWRNKKYICTVCRRKLLGSTKNLGKSRILDTGLANPLVDQGTRLNRAQSTGATAGVHIKVAGDCSDQCVFQMIISFRGQGKSPAYCCHSSCCECSQ